MEQRQARMLCISLFTLIGTGFFLSGCAKKSAEPSLTERGKYLSLVGGCGDCHSPKIFVGAASTEDAKKLLSGHPATAKLPDVPTDILGPTQWGAITTNDMTGWAGPWGVSFAFNLTPDRTTGIGNWSESLFIQSLRNGKFMGTSRDMLPPMPWQRIGTMKDDDLKAIFAYLMSLPPIDNAVPQPIPPSPR
jgi:mono/diheme cytochrome c family protein